MACSKPIHVPSEWAKFVKLEQRDEELMGMDELINWALECGICSEDVVKKYCINVRPYFGMRALYPFVPDNPFCRELFKIFVHFMVLLFIADDTMELLSEDELLNISAGFARLDDLSRNSFPEIPTVEEMKKTINQSSTPDIIGKTVLLADIPNKLVSVFIKHDIYPLDIVYDTRLRASNIISIAIQAVLAGKNKRKSGTLLETLWRRAFDSCTLPFHMLGEVFSGALGKTKQHFRVITELSMCSSFYCVVINDMYSYHLECDGAFENVFKAILAEREGNIVEAVEKNAQIADAILKYMYEKMQETINQCPNSAELRSLFQCIAQSALGWFRMHQIITPRYEKSALKFTLVEVPKGQFPMRLSEKDNYGDRIVKELMQLVEQRMADGKMEALCGAFPLHKNVAAFKEDGLYEIK